ncbi:MAG: hypothetical protein KF802_08760 [Bdellovibrionaceae bacterium]|nr:hypothetical protein [Pseudobdellovibrionaceae bacterium]MBX3034139.1 hypothetical protein [Pseudobdellovibrionaceae bacterium]
MNQIKSFSKRLLKNTKGQGMVEYILLLVVVVAIVMAMKTPLTKYAADYIEQLNGKIGNVFNSN